MKHKAVHLLPILVFLILLWSVGLLWFTTLIPGEPSADTQKTDAIVVLTGGALRLEHGFELLVEGRAPILFISGVEDGLTVTKLLEKNEYHEYAAVIPPGSVILGYKARSTIGNAHEVAQWVTENNIKSIRLVTGNYHMPRSLREIQDTAPELTVIPEPVFTKYFEDNEWWKSAKGIRLVISEYHKYVASIILSKV